ncbi:Mating-type M-specific polypeptide Mc [Schizosaccharomyces pombe]|uniref:Mating-type M-specific polypeptide Mc n=1 Tax=Schizosaccharomyces kambucha TaxID=204045 RepID=MATMC_SCHKA|nr:RecName: Full=Mating-type M-specific polypeptide Mc; Short=mat-Mc [Schizosaccharomyces kambucha]AAQ82722.1 matMc [Schizosaccharomyces kambucha]
MDSHQELSAGSPISYDFLDPDWCFKRYLTKDALHSIETGKGAAYFVPDGFTPILIPNSQSYLLDGNSAQLPRPQPISFTLDQCKVPGYILKSLRKDTKSTERTPRPPNAFILYRKEKHATLLKSNPSINNSQVSKLVGEMWRNESKEVRMRYFKMSEFYKAQHQKMYPGYKYQPRKNKVKR